MIIGELFTGVRILLEKAPSGHHISEDQQLTVIIRKILFFQKTKRARRRSRGGPPWVPLIGRCGPCPGRTAMWGGGPQPPLASSLSRTSSSRKPKAQRVTKNRQ